MQEVKAGIYRIHDSKNKISFVGYSHNLRGILKRFRFELCMNMCIFKPLQIMFNNAGKQVDYDVLEEIDISGFHDEIETDAHLRAGMYKWKKQLETSGETVKIILL